MSSIVAHGVTDSMEVPRLSFEISDEIPDAGCTTETLICSPQWVPRLVKDGNGDNNDTYFVGMYRMTRSGLSRSQGSVCWRQQYNSLQRCTLSPPVQSLVYSAQKYTSTPKTAKTTSHVLPRDQPREPSMWYAARSSPLCLETCPHPRLSRHAAKAHLEVFVEDGGLEEGRVLRTEAVGNVCRMISASDPDVVEMCARRWVREIACAGKCAPLGTGASHKPGKGPQRASCANGLTASKLRGSSWRARGLGHATAECKSGVRLGNPTSSAPRMRGTKTYPGLHYSPFVP